MSRYSPDRIVPDLPSRVFLIVIENHFNSLNKSFARIYLKPQFVRQFIRERPNMQHMIHVFVRDAEMGDIDWREITEDFVK